MKKIPIRSDYASDANYQKALGRLGQRPPPKTPELRKAMSERWSGKPKTPEQKQKMREAKLGKKQSPEHIQKRVTAMKETIRRKKATQEAHVIESQAQTTVQEKEPVFNPNKPHTTIHGSDDGIKFKQNGFYFGATGNFIK
jgi:hypothetical protein